MDALSAQEPVYDEMVNGTGSVRSGWQSLIGAFQALPEGAVAERAERARSQYQDVAIAYRIDPDQLRADGEQRFDLLPMLVSAQEWTTLESGLRQRALLFEAMLADLYGPQRLLREGLVPPALVFANPRYLRPCKDAFPAGPATVHAYAADLIRLPDGSWRVLADRLQAPAGVGFALQNRNILARTAPEIFRACPVLRIEPFFEIWQAALSRLAPLQDRPPSVAVLTPGPFNPAFFEHVYLARQLGAALVEGADLTVRDRRLFIKTLGSLQPVDVVLRFLEDDFCDPLELRGDSVLGVAGLLQAIRAGSVVVVNPLGSNLVETPALRPFLPGLGDDLLGERLTLPTVATEWLGDAKALARWEANPEGAIVKPAFSSPREEQAFVDRYVRQGPRAVAAEIRARPHAFITEERVEPSTIPVWTPQGLVPRPLALRVFLVRAGSDFVAMPGGFTQIPQEVKGPITRLSFVGMSKDTWVLASEREPTGAAQAAPSVSVAIRRQADELRSRSADDLFWLGRYTERLDNAARLLRATTLRLAVDHYGHGQKDEVGHLLRILVEGRILGPSASEHLTDSASLLLTIASACAGESTLNQVFRSVQRISQMLRDRLSNDMWKVVWNLLRDARERLSAQHQDADRLLAAFDNLIGAVAAFGGMASENMTRGSAWRFLDVGRRLERAVYGASVMKELAGWGRDSESALGLGLELCDSSITYRKRYLGALQVGPVLDLILADESNPRGIAFQLRVITQHLNALAASLERMGERPEHAIVEGLLKSIRGLPLNALEPPGDPEARERVVGTLAQTRAGLLELSDTITRAYFSHTLVSHSIGYEWSRP